MMILALDGALARCSAALWRDGRVLASAARRAERGQAALLPPLVDQVLAEAGVTAMALAAVAVGVGPGGFTGLRAAIALAEGIARGAGVPLLGVTTGEALAAALPDEARVLWSVVDNRRGRIVLERFAAGSLLPLGGAEALDIAALPDPGRPIAVAGDAAPAVAAALAARGFGVRLTDARRPDAVALARVAALRLAGMLPPRDATPLYVEPPAIRGA